MTHRELRSPLEVLSKEAGLKAIKPHFSKLKNMQDKLPTDILEKIGELQGSAKQE